MPPVVGREGDSSEIKCPYDENHSTEIKYLCKGKCFTKDAQNIIQSDEAHVNKPKISVKDDTELNLFTVTLSDLRAEDAGIYWCAVEGAFNLPIELMIVLKDGESVFWGSSQCFLSSSSCVCSLQRSSLMKRLSEDRCPSAVRTSGVKHRGFSAEEISPTSVSETEFVFHPI